MKSKTPANGNGSLHWPSQLLKELDLELSTGYRISIDVDRPDQTFEELGRALMVEFFLPTFRRHAKNGGLKAAIDEIHDEIGSLVTDLDWKPFNGSLQAGKFNERSVRTCNAAAFANTSVLTPRFTELNKLRVICERF